VEHPVGFIITGKKHKVLKLLKALYSIKCHVPRMQRWMTC
jgi:hypothetical protein